MKQYTVIDRYALEGSIINQSQRVTDVCRKITDPRIIPYIAFIAMKNSDTTIDLNAAQQYLLTNHYNLDAITVATPRNLKATETHRGSGRVSGRGRGGDRGGGGGGGVILNTR